MVPARPAVVVKHRTLDVSLCHRLTAATPRRISAPRPALQRLARRRQAGEYTYGHVWEAVLRTCGRPSPYPRPWALGRHRERDPSLSLT